MSKRIMVPKEQEEYALAEFKAFWDRQRSAWNPSEDKRLIVRQILLSGDRWLSENPITPTEEKFKEMSHEVPIDKKNLLNMCAEWQRRMFLAEPDPDENPFVRSFVRSTTGCSFTRSEAERMIEVIRMCEIPETANAR